jgi:hypothetical protein
MRDWTKYERTGWSWCVGWNPHYGGYFAQAWRDWPQRRKVEGHWRLRDIVTEGGRTIDEAELKVQERLESRG